VRHRYLQNAIAKALCWRKCEVTVLGEKGSCDETSCWDRFAGFASQAKPDGDLFR
jgi:hypothetical protein